jgi:hypothetical protein
VTDEVYPYLQAYMRYYQALYIDPVRRTDLKRKGEK